MAAKTVRNLISGSGTMSATSGSRVATFSANQTFKPGATIKTNGGKSYTIDSGAGTTWTLMQPAASTESTVAFTMTDTGTGRGRGSSGDLVPDAQHYVYQSSIDDAGNPDCYIYVDTVMPEGGVHPYTRDHSTGSFKTAKSVAQLVPDLNARVRRLEGVLRAGRSTSSLSQDFRLADLVARAYAIERYLNGQQGVPAVGTNATYSEQQFMDDGDPA
jgi:hypothetical protein